MTNDTQLTLSNVWTQINYTTMNSAWRNLWPEAVPDFEGLQSGTASSDTEDIALIDDIVSVRKSLLLKVVTEDIGELVEGGSAELTTDELLHLQHEQQKRLAVDVLRDDEEEKEVYSSMLA